MFGEVFFKNDHILELNDLFDVNINSPADNDFLAYDSASSSWINQTAAEAGLDLIYLKLDGSNANTNIDIGTFDFTTTGTGTFGNVIIGDYTTATLLELRSGIDGEPRINMYESPFPLGAYFRYDGVANNFFIGTAVDNDFDAIRIPRGSPDVFLLGDANVALDLQVSGSSLFLLDAEFHSTVLITANDGADTIDINFDNNIAFDFDVVRTGNNFTTQQHIETFMDHGSTIITGDQRVALTNWTLQGGSTGAINADILGNVSVVSIREFSSSDIERIVHYSVRRNTANPNGVYSGTVDEWIGYCVTGFDQGVVDINNNYAFLINDITDGTLGNWVWKSGLGMFEVGDAFESQGIAQPVIAKSGAYTIILNDHTIICGLGNTSLTVDLPPAADAFNSLTGVGKIFNIKNIGTGTVTLCGDQNELIDEGTTQVINTQFDTITVQSDGTQWWII